MGIAPIDHGRNRIMTNGSATGSPKDMERPHNLSVWIELDDWEWLQKKAAHAGLSVSEFIRETIEKMRAE